MRPVIAAVLRSTAEIEDERERERATKRALVEAYRSRWGPLIASYPYKVWRDEIRRQTGRGRPPACRNGRPTRHVRLPDAPLFTRVGILLGEERERERWTCIGPDCLHPNMIHTRDECFTAEMAEAYMRDGEEADRDG